MQVPEGVWNGIKYMAAVLGNVVMFKVAMVLALLMVYLVYRSVRVNQ